MYFPLDAILEANTTMLHLRVIQIAYAPLVFI